MHNFKKSCQQPMHNFTEQSQLNVNRLLAKSIASLSHITPDTWTFDARSSHV